MWLKLKSLPAGPSAAFEGRRVLPLSNYAGRFGILSYPRDAFGVRFLRRVGPADRLYGEGGSWCGVDAAGTVRIDVDIILLGRCSGIGAWVWAGCNETVPEEVVEHVDQT